ncbi:neuropeptide F receptor-like [Tigriopus californicus]|nr:neuropeptide F receptor-like [Tigriopus californicus]
MSGDANTDDLLYMYDLNRALHQPWYAISALSYAILILLTFLGNALVIWTVVRRKYMWTARNIFILNLAVSDIFLCFTMTITAVDVLTKYWPFGSNTLFLCRAVKAFPCSAVYLSSITIVIIALDRYRFIVHSSAAQLSLNQSLIMLPFIALISMLMGLPVFVHTHLHIPEMALENNGDNFWSHLVFCIEDWTYGGSANTTVIQKENKRHFYSIFSLFFQYILPFTIISVVYSLLYCYLKKHRMVRDDKQLARERARRTNIMLAAISVLYCLCWLPLNFFNLLSDLYEGIFEGHTELMLSVFIGCHLIGMSSACINPFLYGYLNESFRKEFTDIFHALTCNKEAQLDNERNRRMSMVNA